MDTLLGQVFEAHGGLERWRRYSKVEATIVTGGRAPELIGSVRTVAIWA